MKYFLFWVLCASLLNFAFMSVDKRKARYNRWRVPKRAFLCIALLGGTPGALLGMWTFRHKTHHWYFGYDLPALLLAQLALDTWTVVRAFWPPIYRKGRPSQRKGGLFSRLLP